MNNETDTTKENNPQSLVKRIEDISKVIIFILSIFYAIGFLVVSLSLSQYGIIALDLVKSQYLLAGFWFFLSPVGLVILGWLAIKYLPSQSNKNELIKRLFFCVFILTAFIVNVFFFIKEFNILDFKIFSYEGIETGFWLISFLFLVIWTIWDTYPNLKRNSSKKEFLQKEWGRHRFLVVIGVLTLFIAYINEFILTIYPSIPATIGGGKPLEVQIVIKNNSMDNFYNNLLQKNDNTLKCKLLLTTDKAYDVLIEKNGKKETHEISKEMVESIVLFTLDTSKQR